MWRKNTQYDRPGGYFVLEPQEWGSYKKSHGTGELGVVVVAGIKRDDVWNERIQPGPCLKITAEMFL
jgi:hypothetical protein